MGDARVPMVHNGHRVDFVSWLGRTSGEERVRKGSFRPQAAQHAARSDNRSYHRTRDVAHAPFHRTVVSRWVSGTSAASFAAGQDRGEARTLDEMIEIQGALCDRVREGLLEKALVVRGSWIRIRGVD